ncbi:MAG TPA: divalent metal cation transporter [Acidobacteriota bacterium]|jgi:Mn2+/Fe2+ NRAMP family transporter|nr:divalent metal cation transporter [Acidobacteriota bacterium]
MRLHLCLAPKFYAVLGVSMVLGLALDYAGFNAVGMLFWTAVVNGILAPPLIVLVVLLTSDPKVMGKHTNSPLLRALGWITAILMTGAAVTMMFV